MAITVNATQQIQLYQSAASTDAVNDYFLGYNAAAGAYRKYNRNILLNITGSPVGTTDTQTLTGKTLTNPTINSATLSGTLSGTYTFGGTPTFPSSVVTLTGTQSLTNKTLTSPTISGGTISNTTINVDSISGFTTSTIVTVGGVQMNNGTIGTAGAVTSASIAAGAVQPQSLVAGAGTGWSWQTYIPTFTNFAQGNGTVTAKYVQVGKTIFGKISIILGNTSTVTGSVSFTLPVTSVALVNTAGVPTLGNVVLYNAATNLTYGWVAWNSTTTGLIYAMNAASTYVVQSALSSTVPFTWGASMEMAITFSYEAA